jgi:shikimate kinase
MPTAPQTHKPYPKSAKPKPPAPIKQAKRALATNSTAWRNIRAAQLAREPMCRVCARRGILKPANTVDHIDGDAMHDDVNNYQSLCQPCHARKTAVEDGGFQRAQIMPHWIGKPLIPVTVVCGPPGSGKTTYVGQHATQHDLVLDVDVLAAQLFGRPIYHREHGEWFAAMRERNRMLGELSRSTCGHRRCWLIVTGKTPRERMFWKAYATELVVMDVPKPECVARVMADARRPESVKARQVATIGRWC